MKLFSFSLNLLYPGLSHFCTGVTSCTHPRPVESSLILLSLVSSCVSFIFRVRQACDHALLFLTFPPKSGLPSFLACVATVASYWAFPFLLLPPHCPRPRVKWRDLLKYQSARVTALLTSLQGLPHCAEDGIWPPHPVLQSPSFLTSFPFYHLYSSHTGWLSAPEACLACSSPVCIPFALCLEYSCPRS